MKPSLRVVPALAVVAVTLAALAAAWLRPPAAELAGRPSLEAAAQVVKAPAMPGEAR